MANIPNGLSCVEQDDGFVIRRRDANKKVKSIPISKSEAAALLETISSWKDRQAIQGHRPGSIQGRICYPVSRMGFGTEAASGRALLTLQTSPESERTCVLEEAQVHALVLGLPSYVAPQNRGSVNH